MPQRTFRHKARFLLLLSAVAIPGQAAQARSRGDFKGMGVVELMQKYGHPDQILATGSRFGTNGI